MQSVAAQQLHSKGAGSATRRRNRGLDAHGRGAELRHRWSCRRHCSRV